MKFTTLILLTWHIIEALFICPNYLSYFNEFVGGPSQGFLCLRDSNIDWGQDLKGLGKYCRKYGIKELSLAYYGSADPAYYGMKANEITKEEYIKPEAKVYALAVHHIDNAKWYLKYKPTKIIGNSIFVYDFRGGVK